MSQQWPYPLDFVLGFSAASRILFRAFKYPTRRTTPCCINTGLKSLSKDKLRLADKFVFDCCGYGIGFHV